MYVSAMGDALEMYENSPNCQHELKKASEKLGKVLNEAGIRLLMENTSHENGTEIADKENKRGEQLLIKQKERYERDKERLMKKIERDRQKEMLQSKTASGSSGDTVERNSKSVTLPMDAVLAQKDEIVVGDILKSHLKAWRFNRCSIRSNGKRHWGIRQKPKTELVKELKLATSKERTCDADLNIEKLVLGLDDANDCLRPCSKKRIPVKLLQFDTSNRPAFYGVWPIKLGRRYMLSYAEFVKELSSVLQLRTQVVDPRHPFLKDSDIDYDIDSDEDWAEDEPGESLSDCDKDDEDECMEEPIKDDEDNGIEDGFFGEKSDDSHDLDSEVQNRPISEYQSQNDELSEELTGISKLERMALQALTIFPFPGLQNTDISVPREAVDEDPGSSPNKSRTTELSTAADILDSDMPQIVWNKREVTSIVFTCPDAAPAIVDSNGAIRILI
ncbi:hypothetical protein SASPL_139227 [Salvia splendens]|uniref:Chromatin assembly factor 1 subunit A dimerization domain-containing protein n=1 Tax=Salvia splendens TaxID=180675 RepID=A0A8X8WX08_SALSN|nr:hypothetical protein SASPL_139227 [Salvia splendens]